jgi:hypothetical protein
MDLRALRPHRALAAVALSALWACCPAARAQPPLTARLKSARDTAVASASEHSSATVNGTRLPGGRAIAELPARECQRLLRNARVTTEQVPRDAAPHVQAPVYLLSSVGGVEFRAADGMSEHAMLDCRLAVALLAWSKDLARAGVTRVEHYSTYRSGARVRTTGKASGHARALAIDAARFHFRDGRVLDILEDWGDRTRGKDPCDGRHREDADSQVLRSLVCKAVADDLFQVVITPHHDRAHQNHVHLELVPDVDWSYVH